jgi:CheY-like chemotaxis protein
MTQAQPTAAPSAPPRPSVLVAEDDPEMRRLLATVLPRWGFDVMLAHDGDELASLVRGFLAGDARTPVPDLIISDVRMPGHSGLAVLELMRQQQLATPFVVITAFGDAHLHAEATRLGAARVLDKPFDLNHLRSTVLELCAAGKASSPHG